MPSSPSTPPKRYTYDKIAPFGQIELYLCSDIDPLLAALRAREEEVERKDARIAELEAKLKAAEDGWDRAYRMWKRARDVLREEHRERECPGCGECRAIILLSPPAVEEGGPE